jgi:hypothetical protein
VRLTKRGREILEFMLRPPPDEEGELVGERGQWWFGSNRTGSESNK